MAVVQGAIRDWSAALELLQRSWQANRETPLDYTFEFVNSLAHYPDDAPVLAPAFYDDDELVAFVAGFPRSVQLDGRTQKLLLTSFFTVAPEYQGRGYGKAIWASCLALAKDAGYNGVLHYCVEGNISNSVTVAAAKSAGFEAQRVFTVRYLMKLLRPQSLPDSGQAVDCRLFLDAAESLAPGPLSRIWNASQAEWQMVAPCRQFAADANGGVLTGYSISVRDAARTSCFFVEDILWDRLPPEARPALLDRLLARASKTAAVAVLPLLDYTDVSPFRKAGFRASPRLLHAYLTLWDSQPAALQPFRSMYIDVL